MLQRRSFVNEAMLCVKHALRKRQGAFSAGFSDLHCRCENSFYKLGLFVSDHAVSFILISLVVTIVLGGGLAKLRPEDRYERLWTTADSRVALANRAAATHFQTVTMPAQVIVTAAREGDNVMTREALFDVLRLHESLLAVVNAASSTSCCQRQAREKMSGKNRTLLACLHNCSRVQSILHVLNYSRDAILSSNDLLTTVVGAFSQGEGTRTPLAVVLSGVGLPMRRNISSSPALRLIYHVGVDDQSDFDFDERFVSAVEQFGRSPGLRIKAYPLGPSSLDRESMRSFRSDMWLVAVSAALLVAFSMLNVGRVICTDPVNSRAGLALCGIVNVAMAIVASLGLISYCGVLFSPMQIATICVLLAIGVDDMYVLCDALVRQNPADCPSVRERVGAALREVGMSIAMTSVTDAVAFGLAAVDGTPAVQAFAANSSLAVVFDFSFQVTFFVACMALDERRVEAQRSDLICCVGTCRSGERTIASGASGGVAAREPKFIATVFQRHYAPTVIGSGVFQVGALLTGLALLAVALYGARHVSSELDLSETFTQSSFVLRYSDREKKYFADTSMRVDFVVESSSTSAIGLQKTYLQLDEAVSSSPYYQPVTVSWMRVFKRWCVQYRNLKSDLIPEKMFLRWLEDFLSSTVGRVYTNDVRLSRGKTSKAVVASRLVAWQRPGPSTSEQLLAMSASQEIAQHAPTDGETIHAYSYRYRFLDQIAIVRERGHITIIVSLAVIALVTWFFFEGNFFGAALCTVLIALVNVDLLGFMTLWGVEYGHSSHTILVIGHGFSVDYVAHLIRAFTRAEGSSDKRVLTALLRIGPAMFSGALSTFLGVLPLAFGAVATSRIFFKLFFLLITFSTFNGLVLSPILLLHVGRLCDKKASPASSNESSALDYNSPFSSVRKGCPIPNSKWMKINSPTILTTRMLQVSSL